MRRAIGTRGPEARNCGRRKEFEVASDVAKKFSSGKPAGVPALAVMAMPGLRDQVRPTRTKIRGAEEVAESRRLIAEADVLGSVVGIQFEVVAMYTGTMI